MKATELRISKMKTVIVFLLLHRFSLDAIVGLLRSEWDERDGITWTGNGLSQHYAIKVGKEVIWEGMLP